MKVDDTIAAISSAVGPCARIIVRLSGPAAHEIAGKIRRNDVIRLDGMRIPATIYCFSAPHSYTGDDLVEFHLPGNPLLSQLMLRRLLDLGARQAEPGEFTARAFFNEKLDLTQAEGVAAIVSADNDAQLRASRALLAGELATRLRPMMDVLSELLALVEAEIDFSDEGIRFLPEDDLHQRIAAMESSLDQLAADSGRFERTSHEPIIVIAGRPNAGKSSLLNALSGRQRAIVSPMAGTTRDALRAHIPLKRGHAFLIDVAGLDDDVDDHVIAKQMRQRALREIEEADVVVLARDCTDFRPLLSLPVQPSLIVLTKADLRPDPSEPLCVSAKTGWNLDHLRQRLDELAFGADSVGTNLTLNSRHLTAIDDCRASLLRAKLTHSPELIAADLRQALDSLGAILGQVTPDDVLGKIFSAFCIGK